MSSLNGISFIHTLRNCTSWQSLGFVGSIVRGRTRYGGVTSPTLPTKAIAAVARRSSKVRLIKSPKGLQEVLFLNCCVGGRSES